MHAARQREKDRQADKQSERDRQTDIVRETGRERQAILRVLLMMPGVAE